MKSQYQSLLKQPAVGSPHAGWLFSGTAINLCLEYCLFRGAVVSAVRALFGTLHLALIWLCNSNAEMWSHSLACPALLITQLLVLHYTMQATASARNA